MKSIFLVSLAFLAMSLAASAQIVGGPRPACTAFGTTAGTCIQGAGALGMPSSGNGSNLTSLNATNLASGTVPAARLPSLYAQVSLITTNQTVPNTTVTNINFNNVVQDPNSWCNVSSTYRCTPTVAGKYLVTVNETFSATGVGVGERVDTYAQLNGGGGGAVSNQQFSSLSGGQSVLTVSNYIIVCNGSTDYINGAAFFNTTGTNTITAAGQTWMTITYLGQ